MLINIVVGGTFHFPMLANHLINQGHDVRVYTSTPKFKIKNKKIRKICRFIPMPVQIFRKITGFTSHPVLKYIDSLLFDFIVSLLMRDCDLLYGFATSSLRCGKKVKANKGVYVLDRACPHAIFQEEVMNYEYEKLELKKGIQPNSYLNRALNEYTIADYICVPSLYTKKTFIDNDIASNKLLLTPLEATFSLPKPKKFKINNKNLTIGVVGSGFVRKGYIYLFEAVSKLSLFNVELIVLANETELRSCKKIRQLLNINKNIRILGYMSNINTFYDSCDIFCLPSVDEGFGMVIMEALSHSLPIITTSNVGASTYVKNKINGFVIKPRDVDGLIKKIKFFYFDRNKIMMYGKNSYTEYKQFLKKQLYKVSIEKVISLTSMKLEARNIKNKK